MKARSRTTSLRAQILIRTLVVGLIPLALLTLVAVFGLRSLNRTADLGLAESRRVLAEQTVTARLQSEAQAAGREIDLVLAERINDVVTWSRQPAVISGSEVAAQLAAANGLLGLDTPAAEARFAGAPSLGAAPLADAFLEAELARRNEFVDISYTDRNGYNAGLVGTPQDFVQSDEAWWQSAWDNGVYVGGVTFHPESGQYVIPISSRIENDSGRRVGVLRASLGISFVQAIADLRTTDDLDLSVITADRQLLAETATGHDPARIGSTELTSADLSAGVNAALGESEGTVVADDAVHGFTRVASTRGAVDRDDQVNRFDWFVVTSQGTEAAFAPLSSLEELEQELSDAGQRLSLVTLFVLLVSAIAAVMMATVLSRRIVTPIRMLTERARLAADHDLPAAVARAQDGDEGPARDDHTRIEISAGNELDELVSSFNSVQRTAIRLAGAQAHQRRTASEMFANLGRRNQSLVKRQLRFIEELERSEEDPDRLSSLFKLDHLATRMRRNAESLLVIAGHRPTSRVSEPVRIELVAQAALGEVESFERVDLAGLEPVSITGRAVGDLAHLLAELIENALTFSPPEAPVAVTGTVGRSHYRVSIVDRGIGMSADELDEANVRLEAGADVDLTTSKQLGLFVVSKLAARHDVIVRLVDSETAGVVAQVDIPYSLIEVPTATPPRVADATRPHRAAPPIEEASPSPPATLAPPATSEPPRAAPVPAASAPAASEARVAATTAAADVAGPQWQRRRTDPSHEPDAGDEAATPAPTEPDAGDEASTPAPTERPVASPATATPTERTGRPPTGGRGDLGGLSPVSASQITTVTRRESRRDGGMDRRAPSAEPKDKRRVAVTDSFAEVETEAAQLRNRWSSFQQGRREASPDGAPPAEQTDDGAGETLEGSAHWA